jgi:hypothetical protein
VTAIHPALNEKGKPVYSYKYIKENEKGRRRNTPDSRCWGWYSDLKVAMEHVQSNVCDFSEEGFYSYAVIEEIPEGIEPIYNTDEKWFKFDPKKEKYIVCSKPEFSNHILNWSIG